MIQKSWVLGAIFTFFSFGAMAEPKSSIGMIKVSKGEVSILRAGTTIAGGLGAPVFVADKVRTGANSAVGISLKDNTLLSAGPNSVLTLDKFVFNRTTHVGAMSVGVKRGTLAVATGKIAKQTPESVDFHTPSSILGVRGTEFAIEVIADEEE